MAWFDGVTWPKVVVKAQFGESVAGACVRGSGVRGTAVRGGRAMVDISANIRSVEWSRGWASPLDAAEPGQATIVVNNVTGDYDPTNLDGPYASRVLSGGTPTDVQPVLFDTADGTQAASPTGCTNSIVYIVSHANLLTDNQSRLTTNTAGWNAGIATSIARTTAQASSGIASLQLTKTTGAGTILANTNAPDIGQGAGANLGPNASGKTFTAVAKFRAQATARSCQLRLIYYNVGGTNIGEVTGSSVTDATTGWSLPASVSLMAPAGATQAAVEVQVSGAALGEVHFAADVDLHEGTDLEFVPGGVTFPADGTYHDMGGASAPSPNGTSPATAAGATTFWGDVAGTFASCRWQLRPDLDPSGVGAGYFWSNQGYLEAAVGGAGNQWYFGLQANGNVPTPSFVGKTINFAIWGATAAVAGDIANTYAGTFTGEGDGYRIAAPFAWTAGRTYTLLVGTDPSRGERWFRADIRDDTTGVVTWVGSIQAGTADSPRLRGVSYQFSELFAQTTPASTCPLLPRSTTFFSTPTFSQSAPGASRVDLGALVTIQAERPAGMLYDRFTGEIVDIAIDAGMDPTVTFTVADGLEKLGRVQLAAEPAQWDQDSSGERIGHIADRATWPATARLIDHGQTILGPTLLDGSALELLRQVESTEFGHLFVDPHGNLVFYERHRDTTASRSATVQARITDTSGAGELPMMELILSKSRERIYNDVHVTRQPDPTQDPELTGSQPGDVPVEQVAQDATSIATFGGVLSFPAQVGQLLTNDPDAKGLAAGIAGLYAAAQVRIREVRINALHPDIITRSLWPTILELGLLDRIAVDRGYGTSPSRIAAELLIQQVTETISSDPPTWELRMTTAEPPPLQHWCVRGQGVRGVDTRGW